MAKQEKPTVLTWVIGRSGVEEADKKAKETAMLWSDIATLASIRQAYPIHHKLRHLKWGNKTVKGRRRQGAEDTGSICRRAVADFL